MAKAYQCDRCGKLCKKDVNIKPKFVIHLQNYSWLIGVEDTDEIMDLCPDCQEKLEKFITEGGFYDEKE